MMGKDFVSLSLFLASVRAVKDWKVDQAKGLGSNPSYNACRKLVSTINKEKTIKTIRPNIFKKC